MKLAHVIGLLVGICMSSTSMAANLWVPSDYAHPQLAVDAAVDGDVVILAPGTYQWVPGICSGAIINIQGKAITIRSEQGWQSTIIDGENQHPCIWASGAPSGVVISGFKIHRGYGCWGGGIQTLYTNALVRYCVISDCLTIDWQGYSSGIWGGGIHNHGDITLDTVTVENNTAFAGAGMYSENGAVTMSNCLFRNNTKYSGGYWYTPLSMGGGGLYVNKGTLSITGSTFENNNMPGGGGGLTAEDCDVTMHDSIFFNNHTQDNSLTPWGTGGGASIRSSYSTPVAISISNCTFKLCDSDRDSGGLHLFRVDGEVRDCQFESCVAGGAGGGLTVRDCNPDIINCDIRSNSASDGGGGLACIASAPTLTDCFIMGNTIPMAAVGGGGLYSDLDSYPMLFSTIVCENEYDQIYGNWDGDADTHYNDICLPGACCTGESCELMTEDECGGFGTWLGFFSSCDECLAIDEGACCLQTGLLGCAMVDPWECEQLDGVWDGGPDCSMCAILGACCNGTDCEMLNMVDCDNAGTDYVWGGQFSTCDTCGPATGACCLAEGFRGGGCPIVDWYTCNIMGGTYMGDNTDCTACEAPGACCSVNGCVMLMQADCELVGGLWTGDGMPCASNCPPAGACCLSCGCLQMFEVDCDAMGGTWLLNDDCAMCPPAAITGACCMSAGCGAMDQVDCDALNGTWLGAGVSCLNCPPPCPGDVNSDGVVDIDDVLIMLSGFGPC
jgi:hypothetical protein